MKKLVTFLLLLISSITYSQSGVGYLNYTVYNIISNGAGAYANNAIGFVNMFDISKGATIYTTGTTTAQKALYFQNSWQSSGVPNGGAYTGIKIEGFFVPKETGTYTFGIDGDDGVDFSLDGNVVTSFYGGHGFGGYRYGSVNLIAGKSYKFMARYQNWGGGWGMFLVWKRPSQTTFSLQSDEVTTTEFTPSKKAIINFDFGGGIDKTKFLVNTSTNLNNSWSLNSTNITSQINTLGVVDITSSLDSNRVSNGNRALIVGGGVEWSYVNIGNTTNTLYIDLRKFGNTLPSSITNVKILDVYDGPVIYQSSDIYWATYTIPSNLPKITDGTSTNTQYIRTAGYNNYAFTCDISFTPSQFYKTQGVSLTTTNNLSTLYNSILTVSDVYLAFKELANGGLFGNQTGNEFTYGIQYKNADINNDNIFNETDCFLLLKHLMGVSNIVDTFTLDNTLNLFSQTTYNNIGKSNWNSFTTFNTNRFVFDLNTGNSIDNFNVYTSWKGDVNLSHSSTPISNGITTNSIRSMNSVISNEINAYVMGEIIGGKLIITITLDPLQQQVVGTQFQLNYDKNNLKFEKVEFTTKGNPMNYGTDKGTYVNIGSLITDGSTTLDNTTEYKIIFTPLIEINGTLGLSSVSTTDAVNKNGTQLKVRMR